MQRIVMAALLAGALAGFVAFALHMWQTTPLILHAEIYESGEASHDHEIAAGAKSKARARAHEDAPAHERSPQEHRLSHAAPRPLAAPGEQAPDE